MKAGIKAVTAVCSAPQDSDSFSFSIFGSIRTTFLSEANENSPYSWSPGRGQLWGHRGESMHTPRVAIAHSVASAAGGVGQRQSAAWGGIGLRRREGER